MVESKDKKEFIVFGKPHIAKDEINEMIDTLESGWIGTGPKTKLFERSFAEYVGAKYAIGLNSCTAGLHLALDTLDISEGDEIITTPMTFAATANVIEHRNAKPIFVDVSKDDMNIDVDLIEKAITPKTRVIMPVHFAGRPCKMDRINEIANKYRLSIIADAAHAVEAKYNGKRIGEVSDVTVFSFYANKNLTTGEGGMIVTDNEELAEKMRIRSSHGLSKNAWKRYSKNGYKSYDVLYPGYKYNMTDMQASLGIHQLKKIEMNLIIRENIWGKYDKAFKGIDALLKPNSVGKLKRHARHLYIILLDLKKLSITRDEFVQCMNDCGIGTGVHYKAIHLHDYYKKKYSYKRGNFKNAEWISDRTLSLPLSPYLTEQDTDNVINTVKEIINIHLKSF